MPFFSCLRARLKQEPRGGNESLKHAPGANVSPKTGAQSSRTVNEQFLKLLYCLSSVEGTGLHALVEACKATCDQLEADHVSVSLIGSDKSCTVVACSGLEEESTLGQREHLPLRGADTDSHVATAASVADVVLRRLETGHTAAVLFEEVPTTAGGGFSGFGVGGGRRSDLPEWWRRLHADHGCRQFASAALVTAGVTVGVLSVAAKAPCRPSSWSAEAFASIALLLAGHVRNTGVVLADALSQLHSACTISEVVAAVGEAAVEVSSAVAHIEGQARVAFLQPDASAAAIFQQPSSVSEGSGTAAGVAPQLVSRGQRTSCEYVMSNTATAGGLAAGGSRKGFRSRASMEASAVYAPTQGSVLGQVTALVAEGRHNSLTDASVNGHRTKSRMSFLIPYDKGASSACKGHTLPLSGTLLADALSREATGLCVSDCASYVQDKRAFPRDAVLSRDGVMPLSLALATLSSGGRPLVALYVTYSTSLPQSLLQSVVEGLRQLLQAILPIIKLKLEGPLAPEWQYLRAQLEEAVRRRCGGDFGHASDLDYAATVTANGMADGCPPDGGAGSGVRLYGNNSGKEDSSAEASFAFNAFGGGGGGGAAAAAVTPVRLSAVNARTGMENSGATPFSTLAATEAVGAVGGGLRRRPSLLGRARSEGPAGIAAPTPRRPNSALRRLLGLPMPTCASEPPLRCDTSSAGGGGNSPTASDSESSLSAAGPSDYKTAPPGGRRLLSTIRSVSFRLEAAKSPRGASRLAPIITIMHERLKAAQAAQMTLGGRTEARKADLQSVKLLQEIGKGGYGTVYRGTYHGSEVAVKVIQEKELAAITATTSDPAGDATALAAAQRSGSVILHKQNLHDAIELVASVSVSHPNIVQVLTFFTDCKLQLSSPPDPSGASNNTLFDSSEFGDQMANGGGGGGGGGMGPRLIHMPSLLESPAPGQELGGISVALVMEFMDAGSLSDAIQKRIFFERLEINNPVAGSRASKGLLAVSMRSVYATLLEIALALRHMHSLHLVHCDLKPQNVLLKTAPRDPRGFTAKLSDFGLAKTLAQDGTGQLVIDEAVASGTITHIAPEVFMGKKSLGAAVDIYAFGIIMYQVLCGMRLYDGMTAQEIANNVAHRMLRPSLPPWVPANYRALAERCWHQLPSVRPTADELVRQLEKLSDFRKRNMRPQSESSRP